jgi:hypothetical protein
MKKPSIECEELFVALARLSCPLQHACERAIDVIRDNSELSECEKEAVRASVKHLINSQYELNSFLAKFAPQFDWSNAGKKKYDELKNEYSYFFPKSKRHR